MYILETVLAAPILAIFVLAVIALFGVSLIEKIYMAASPISIDQREVYGRWLVIEKTTNKRVTILGTGIQVFGRFGCSYTYKLLK